MIQNVERLRPEPFVLLIPDRPKWLQMKTPGKEGPHPELDQRSLFAVKPIITALDMGYAGCDVPSLIEGKTVQPGRSNRAAQGGSNEEGQENQTPTVAFVA